MPDEEEEIPDYMKPSPPLPDEDEEKIKKQGVPVWPGEVMADKIKKESKDLFYKFDLRLGKILDIQPKNTFNRIYHMWVNFGQSVVYNTNQIKKLPVILSNNM